MLENVNIDDLYSQMFQTLEDMTAVIKFIKKDGSIRVMLCTRNKTTASLLCDGNNFSAKLGGFDKKANIGNHNIPVIDLVISDVRTFCIERLEGYQFLGVITAENSDMAFNYYNLVMEQLEEEQKKKIREKEDEAKSLIDLV